MGGRQYTRLIYLYAISCARELIVAMRQNVYFHYTIPYSPTGTSGRDRRIDAPGRGEQLVAYVPCGGGNVDCENFVRAVRLRAVDDLSSSWNLWPGILMSSHIEYAVRMLNDCNCTGDLTFKKNSRYSHPICKGQIRSHAPPHHSAGRTGQERAKFRIAGSECVFNKYS